MLCVADAALGEGPSWLAGFSPLEVPVSVVRRAEVGWEPGRDEAVRDEAGRPVVGVAGGRPLASDGVPAEAAAFGVLPCSGILACAEVLPAGPVDAAGSLAVGEGV